MYLESSQRLEGSIKYFISVLQLSQVADQTDKVELVAPACPAYTAVVYLQWSHSWVADSWGLQSELHLWQTSFLCQWSSWGPERGKKNNNNHALFIQHTDETGTKNPKVKGLNPTGGSHNKLYTLMILQRNLNVKKTPSDIFMFMIWSSDNTSTTLIAMTVTYFKEVTENVQPANKHSNIPGRSSIPFYLSERTLSLLMMHELAASQDVWTTLLC